MRIRTALSTAAGLVLLCLFMDGRPVASAGPDAGSKRLVAVVDAARRGEPISGHIYGQFLENLGDVVNGRLWAEMIDDRKFFYPVDSSEALKPVNTRPMRRWRPIGPDPSVVMDRVAPYAGDHSPKVLLDGDSPRGMRQGGFRLRAGKAYAGRVVLAGDPAVRVEISLIWGPGPADRQSVAVDGLVADFAKHPLGFTAGADTDDGVLEISGRGTGAFRVGAVSLMPADNVRGMRPDTLRLLKEIGFTFCRWPGGNFVSGYDWRDGVGDPDRRPQRYDYAWNALEPNDFGLDEFIDFCRLLDLEPYVSVNSGFGDARMAAEEVEYANGSATTPMGALRAANGHREPYAVRWWSIGNEMYGWWQLGHMALDHYVIKHNVFAEAMRRADPTIRLFAAGAAPDETTVTHMSTRLTGMLKTEYDSPADFTGGLLRHCADAIDFLSEHFYCYWGKGWDLRKNDFVPVEESLAEAIRRVPNRVRCKAEAYDDYLERHPVLRERRIPMVIDEWNYGDLEPFSLKGALSLAEGLHEMFRHTGVIAGAAYTMGTSCLAQGPYESVLQTNGLVFKLYRRHFGTVPLEVSGNSPMPPIEGEPGGDKPRVSSGSPTYPLDVSAALTADGRTLTLAVVNPTQAPCGIDLEVRGLKLSGKGKAFRLSGADENAFNEPGRKPGVEIVERSVGGKLRSLVVDPLSAVLYELEVAR